MPDYQLEWVITSCDVNGTNNQFTDVQYTLQNTGFEKLYDVTVEIEITNDPSGFIIAWTSPVDLDVGTSRNFSTSINTGYAFTNPLATITGAAWNIEQ